MSTFYPNIDEREVCLNGICLTCKKPLNKKNPGVKFNVEYSFMNGDDETEIYCAEHGKVFSDNVYQNQRRKEETQRYWKQRESENQANHFSSLIKKLSEKYQVKVLTASQWRINDIVDVYPVNMRFHDLKRNKRGNYSDVFKFCDRFFKTNSL